MPRKQLTEPVKVRQIEKLIKLANSAPFTYKFVQVAVEPLSDPKSVRDLLRSMEQPARGRQFLIRITRDLPDCPLRRVIFKFTRERRFSEMVKHYRHVAEVRGAMQAISVVNRCSRSFQESNRFPLAHIEIDLRVKEGRALIQTAPHWSTVLEGAEIARIRRCEVCRVFFWAKRIGTAYCDFKKCGNRLNSRKSYKRHWVRYKQRQHGVEETD